MELSDIVGEIRDQLVKHRLAPRKFLWRTMLKQIAKQGCFDGSFADTIEEMIKALLRPLDDAAITSLWLETEVGLCNEHGADRYFADDLRYDVQMEIFEQIMDQAGFEATGQWPEPRGDFDDPEPDWD